MARINNVFSQGKMNKDLDERIIPNGEYRDAMNIQLSTSDGSDVGVIQNLLGNQLLSSNINIAGGVCVGTVVDEKDNAIYWFVTDSNRDMILQYKNGSTTTVFNDPSKQVLKFNQDNIITGINILDDFLFWTDNEYEPKKIHIQRSIDGTNQNIIDQTKLVVNNSVTATNVTEDHITVIKKSPKYPPVLEMSDGRREGLISATLNFDFTNLQVGNQITFNDHDLGTPGTQYNWNVDDVLVLQSYEDNVPLVPLEEFEVKLQITQVNVVNTTPAFGLPTLDVDYIAEIVSISSTTPIGIDAVTGLAPFFVIDLFDPTEKIFEFKFPRFAYRWKYEDKEYSTFSPFSEVAFLPGPFDYHPKKGFNLGMVNNLSQLFIKEFVTSDTPEDVVAIDILYKESNSANVYIVDTLRKDDPFIKPAPYNEASNAWTYQNLYDGVNSIQRDGKYEIKSETIYATLPSNQLLRSYDTVPRKALAQEITGNRLVYGNYVQNYDLDNLVANFNVGLSTFENVEYSQQPSGSIVNTPNKSLKSIRDYQIGVVYLDEYGRQTPILSSNTGIKKLSKNDGDNYNQFKVQCKHDPPAFAKRFKFYIKETSNEYYNLALDRYYDSEDDNIWLSFPSSDRNKVDIDTFLILKKGTESNDLVTEEARYKVLAIENEAPDYIKRNELALGKEFHNNTTNDIFTQDTNNFPLQSRNSFSINYEPFKNSSLDNLHKLLEGLNAKEEIQVYFENTSTQQASRKYRVTNISATLNTDGTPEPGTQITFQLDSDLESDINFIYDETNLQIKNVVSVSFEKVIVENSPEFDGRFFVKIYTDDIIKKYLDPAVTAETQYRTVSSRKIYYKGSNFLDLHSNGETTLNGDNYHDNGVLASTFNASTGSNYQEDLWNYWYKFCAYARQSRFHTPDSDRISNTETVTAGTYQDVWFVNHYKWADQSSGINDTSGSYSNTDHCNIGSNFGPGITKQASGITSWSNISRIQISFTGLEPDPDNLSKASGILKYYIDDYNNGVGWTTGTSSIYNVGEGNKNELYAGEESFVNSLQVGKKLRWAEDPTGTVYTIISVTRGYHLEYNGDDSNTTYNRFTRPENYATSWVMYLDKPIAWDPVSPNDGQEPMNGFSPNTNPYAEFAEDGVTSNTPTSGVTWNGISIAQGYTLEAVEPIYDDKVMPTNPSVFETEPKENIDLDIYYEASPELPIILDEQSLPNIIKIGSVVTVPAWNTTANLGAGQATLTAFQPAPSLGTVLFEISNPNLTGFNLPANTILQFTSEGKTINLQTQAPTNISSTPGKVYVIMKLDLHDSPVELDWFNCYSFANGVESNRVRDNFNAVTIDKGAVVSTTLDDQNLYNEDRKTNGLIFSGIYNSIGGINELNQFIQAEKITKDINPTYGSVQKLFSRNTDLISFCEDRVIKILANKDAIFNADGNPQLTANQNVLGQVVPFVGDYGISQNPESFASESYRAYFTDKQRGAVLRLSMDGLTPISNDGMRDYFGEKLKNTTHIVGSYDNNKEEYNLTALYQGVNIDDDLNTTVSYDEKVKGWTSFKSFVPENGCSIQNDYFTFKNGNIYKHHVDNTNANEFYGIQSDSKVEFVFNQEPSLIKSFNTIMYEGSQGKVQNLPGYVDNNLYGYKNLYNKDGWYVEEIITEKSKGSALNFLEKEDKWFSSIRGKSEDQNDIDLKNFSVQGIGSISSINVNI